MKGLRHFRGRALLSLISLILCLCGTAIAKQECPAGDVIYFASFSVPESSLKAVLKEAFLRNGRVRFVFRGVPEKNGRLITLREFTHMLKKLVRDVAQEIKEQGLYAPGRVRFQIDPVLYRKFSLRRVPAFVFCPEQRILIGDVSLSMAERYLKVFSDRQRILYGHDYEIEEKDLLKLAKELSVQEKDFTSLVKKVSKRAKKRLLTGIRLPHAKSPYERRVSLAEKVMDEGRRLYALLEDAPENVKKVLLIDHTTAERLVKNIASVSRGEVVIMADAENPEQMRLVEKILQKNKKAVALLSGYMETYYWKHYPQVFPLHKYEADMWEVKELPAVLFLNKQGEVVIRVGLRWLSEYPFSGSK